MKRILTFALAVCSFNLTVTTANAQSPYEKMRQTFEAAVSPASLEEVIQTISTATNPKAVQCVLFSDRPSETPKNIWFDDYKIVLAPLGPFFSEEQSLRILKETGFSQDLVPTNHVQSLSSEGLYVENVIPHFSDYRTNYLFRKKDNYIVFAKRMTYKSGYQENWIGYCKSPIAK